nr:hypothetical protein [candidate division Zixibacteria bacterium]
MTRGTFATAINCMDGRVQLPVINFMKERYKVDHVDKITAQGPIKILSENRDMKIVEAIRERVAISVEQHGSKVIAITGHHDCAGNPVDRGIQLKQLDKTAALVRGWGFKAEIIKLWIDENWEVTPVE